MKARSRHVANDPVRHAKSTSGASFGVFFVFVRGCASRRAHQLPKRAGLGNAERNL